MLQINNLDPTTTKIVEEVALVQSEDLLPNGEKVITLCGDRGRPSKQVQQPGGSPTCKSFSNTGMPPFLLLLVNQQVWFHE